MKLCAFYRTNYICWGWNCLVVLFKCWITVYVITPEIKQGRRKVDMARRGKKMWILLEKLGHVLTRYEPPYMNVRGGIWRGRWKKYTCQSRYADRKNIPLTQVFQHLNPVVFQEISCYNKQARTHVSKQLRRRKNSDGSDWHKNRKAWRYKTFTRPTDCHDPQHPGRHLPSRSLKSLIKVLQSQSGTCACTCK